MKEARGKREKDFRLALSYTLLIFLSLYFTPFARDFLAERVLLSKSISGLYIFCGALFLSLFFYKYRIKSLTAYFLFFILLILFLYQFFETTVLVERIHLLEYGLLYIFWHRTFRHFFKGVMVYGSTLCFSIGMGLLDEWLQGLLPNRFFTWDDVYLNLYGITLGILSVAVFMRYRRDQAEEIKLSIGKEGESKIS